MKGTNHKLNFRVPSSVWLELFWTAYNFRFLAMCKLRINLSLSNGYQTWVELACPLISLTLDILKYIQRENSCRVPTLDQLEVFECGYLLIQIILFCLFLYFFLYSMKLPAFFLQTITRLDFSYLFCLFFFFCVSFYFCIALKKKHA